VLRLPYGLTALACHDNAPHVQDIFGSSSPSDLLLERKPSVLFVDHWRGIGLIWLYLKMKTNLLDGEKKRFLHVAPEPCISSLVRRHRYIDYFTADLCEGSAMVQMDIASLPFHTGAFNAIYCSHVLEHVPEDRKAIAELCRVLKPDGWAILQVPIVGDVAFEDPTATTPERRTKLFGQHDHVRRYGKDFKCRLEASGFTVSVDGFARQFSDREQKRWGLKRDEDIYFCRKS